MKRKRWSPVPPLPDDLLRKILVRLLAKPVLHFCTVCKSWHHLTSDLSFLLAYRAHVRVAPLLLVYDGHHQPRSTFRDLWTLHGSADWKPQQLTSYRDPDFLFSLCASCDGLLCFTQQRDIRPYRDGNVDIADVPMDCVHRSFVICNPLVAQWANLPPPIKSSSNTAWGLYFHPSTQEYRLLYWSGNGHHILETGTSATMPLPRPFDGTPPPSLLDLFQGGPPYAALGISPSVILHGNLHWAPTETNSIMVFDTSSEKFQQMAGPRLSPESAGSDHKRYSVIDMGGTLCFSVVNLWHLSDYHAKETS